MRANVTPETLKESIIWLAETLEDTETDNVISSVKTYCDERYEFIREERVPMNLAD